MTPDVVIVGGGYAGLMASGRLAAAGRSVVLVDPKPAFVERLRLHRRLAGRATATRPWASVLPRTVTHLMGVATAWDGDALTVGTAAGDRELRPRRLLVAAGSRTRVPWRDDRVVDLEDLSAARTLGPRAHVVVAGGGATGVETAAALAWSGRRVTLVADAFPGLGEGAEAALRAGLADRGVRVVHDRLASVDAGAAQLAGGAEVRCDAVVPCLGFAPSPLARAWGLPTDARGRVPVAPTLRVNERVYVAGDIATVPSMPWVGSGAAVAMPMGAHAADSIDADLAGEPAPVFRFGWTSKNLDLCGGRGVLQPLTPAGAPTGAPRRGWASALPKQLVFALTTRLGRWEAALRTPLYRWHPGPPAPPHTVAVSER